MLILKRFFNDWDSTWETVTVDELEELRRAINLLDGKLRDLERNPPADLMALNDSGRTLRRRLFTNYVE